MTLLSSLGRVSRSAPLASKLLLLGTLSGGSIVAYSDSNTEVSKKEEQRKKKVVVLWTGWAGISFLKDLDITSYDVQVVSPQNYFAFTPLLPSVTCGTVEARSIVESVRNITKKKNGEIELWEADCFKIVPVNQKVHCRPVFKDDPEASQDFSLGYDYLIVAVGAQVNTFGTPGVRENCHFLRK